MRQRWARRRQGRSPAPQSRLPSSFLVQQAYKFCIPDFLCRIFFPVHGSFSTIHPKVLIVSLVRNTNIQMLVKLHYNVDISPFLRKIVHLVSSLIPHFLREGLPISRVTQCDTPSVCQFIQRIELKYGACILHAVHTTVASSSGQYFTQRHSLELKWYCFQLCDSPPKN